MKTIILNSTDNIDEFIQYLMFHVDDVVNVWYAPYPDGDPSPIVSEVEIEGKVSFVVDPDYVSDALRDAISDRQDMLFLEGLWQE